MTAEFIIFCSLTVNINFVSTRMNFNFLFQTIRKQGLIFRLRVVNGLPGKSALSPEVGHPLYQATVDK